MAGRAAPTAIARSNAQGCLACRRRQSSRSSAPAARDRFAPKRRERWTVARRRLRPGAEIVGGEVSLRAPAALNATLPVNHRMKVEFSGKVERWPLERLIPHVR